jgi:hypothetical protein
MLLVSMVRSGPVYGKLDFILVDSKNWWYEMQPMIEEVLMDGSQPIYTDSITGFIFEKLFGQKLFEFTQNEQSVKLNITTMNIQNRPFSELATLQAIYTSLLLAEKIKKSVQGATGTTSDETLVPESFFDREEVGPETDRPKRPYRCVINLKGFTPTWVPSETRHWRTRAAKTSRYYYVTDNINNKNVTGHTNLVEHVIETPLKNCRVYY